ncbi:MAG: hypothetical protein ABI697_00305 [Devosia sp.]
MIKAIGLGVVACFMLVGAAAQAQQVNASQEQLQGQWVSDRVAQGIPMETVVTITGNTYISTQSMLSSGVLYSTTQSGEIFVTPPNFLNLAVTDWSPKEYNGRPMSMPPSTFWTILKLTQTQLAVAEPYCLQKSPLQECLVLFNRR